MEGPSWAACWAEGGRGAAQGTEWIVWAAEGPWGGQGPGGVGAFGGASWRAEEGLPGHWCTVGWHWQPGVAFGNMWAALAHQNPLKNLFADLEGVGVEEADMSEGRQWVECRRHQCCGIVDVKGDFGEKSDAELD